MCDVISVKNVKTRKPHRCFGCQRSVPIGTTIQRSVNAEDGQIYNIYMCDICVDAMEAESKAQGGGICFGEGDFAPSVQEAGLDLRQPVAQ